MSDITQADPGGLFCAQVVRTRILLGGMLMLLAVDVLAVEEFKTPQQVENESAPVEVEIEGAERLREKVIDPQSPVLIESLNAIVIHPASEFVQVPAAEVQGIQIDDDNLFRDSSVFKAMLERYLGKPLSVSELDYLVSEIIVHYRERDYPLVDVALPEQDITEGVLQIVVVEAEIGNVAVTGNRYFSDDFIKGAMTTREGDKPHISTVYEDVNWLSKNPYLRVQPVFGEGEEEGTTDMFLQAEDAYPMRVYTSYSNAGNDLIGKDQYSVGMNYGNLWGVGHQVNYQFTQARNADFLNSHAVSYLAPLPWRHDFTVTASRTRTEAAEDVLDVSGKSDEAAAVYSVPLTSSTRYSHGVSLGLEWKRSKNALEFGVQPVLGTVVELGQFVLSYNGEFGYAMGKNAFNLAFVKSSQGLFDEHNDEAFQEARQGSEASYSIGRLAWEHSMNLPYQLAMVNSLTLQGASTNLVSNEQFYPTGANAVRGYDPGLFSNVDRGLLVRNDFYSPPFSLAQVDNWRLLVFLDHAKFSAHSGSVSTPTGAADEAEVSSAGFGFRMKIKKNLTVNADYGFQLKDVGAPDKNERAHVKVSLQY
jgi:hemolysin activation/secretion protein